MFKQPECRTGLRVPNSGRKPSIMQELNSIRETFLAGAEIDCHLMDTVDIQHCEVGRGGTRVATYHIDVIHLDPQSYFLQALLLEKGSIPFLYPQGIRTDPVIQLDR